MAKKIASRAVQYVLAQEFTFDITDTMVATNGVEQSFKAAAGIFDVIKMPQNAVLVGGDLTVETVSDDTGTATLKVGDADSDARYLAATNLKAAARTALVPTGYRGTGKDLRITLANQNGNATAGKVTVRAEYLIQGRAQEVQPN
jgi:hypothetical protein